MNFTWQLLALSIALFLNASVNAADVDCSKRPARVNLMTCCPIPELISDELKEKCKEYEMSPEAMKPFMSGEESSSRNNEDNDDASQRAKRHPTHHRHHHNPCFASCILNETEIYINKTVNVEKFKEYLQTVFQDSSDLQSTLEESLTTCATKIEQFQGGKPFKRPPPPTLDGVEPRIDCPYEAGKLMGCIFIKTFKNCPASLWNDTEKCNNLRAHIETCKRPNGPRRGGPPNDLPPMPTESVDKM